MTTATEASAVEAMIPTEGMPRDDSCANTFGNSPSLAAASGISAQIMVQPLRAPMPEMITRAATRSPDHAPPKISLAADAYDALLLSWERAVAGRIPKTATSDSM